MKTDIRTFVTVYRLVLLRMRYVSDSSCTENQDTHFVFNDAFFFENRAVYEIMCNNSIQPDRPQMTI